MPGFAELVLILIVVLVIFGAGKLPYIANAVGKAIVKMREKSKHESDEPEPDDKNEQS